MSRMMVVVNGQNTVLGTLVVDGKQSGSGAPERCGIQPGPGERVVEMEVDDSLTSLPPAELHAAIAARHLQAENRMVVVVSADNTVLGTLVVSGARSGKGAPERFGIQTGPGQRVIEIAVDDAFSALPPAELHCEIARRHLS
jgi:hypothetical protein